MKQFSFCGEAPASKSLLNRWLLIADYAPQLQIEGASDADDVRNMREGLKRLHKGDAVDCGAAAAVFRFLCLRASRVAGLHVIYGTPRLMQRPHDGLLSLLDQLGVSYRWQTHYIEIAGGDWRPANDQVEMETSHSSQFASSLVLNAWNLARPITLRWNGQMVSEGYFNMSLRVAAQAGMELQSMGQQVGIREHQAVTPQHVTVEADLSSTFALAAIAALAGSAEFVNFPFSSLQPDLAFVDILQRMMARLEYGPTSLKVHRSPSLSGVTVDLRNCPDLFPVLAVLCGCANGVSHLHGAPHLQHKESDRLRKTSELLTLMGVVHELRDDGMVITGAGLVARQSQPRLLVVRTFDPDQDHRLAMAAEVANWAGIRLEVLNREVVSKSFPGFWDLAGVGV